MLGARRPPSGALEGADRAGGPAAKAVFCSNGSQSCAGVRCCGFRDFNGIFRQNFWE